MKTFLCALFAVLVCIITNAADACYSCGNALHNWGTRLGVCSSPSSAELDAVLDCLCWAGPCAADCGAFCDSYDICLASNDPACAFVAGGAQCDQCSASPSCASVTSACGADTTGCVTCASWIGGGDELNICPASTGAAISLSVCACDGACAQKCTAECTRGYLDSTAMTAPCVACIEHAQSGCRAEYSACTSI
jgi:hypothetical protein